ncbi:BamA/TamA family outer membrane protein [Ramlibacter sp.]|uniref:autotransporter assembly complex protein TamA n=1 Tax=Ramlibacter sp. TaxID=1917967 RepID=UPI0017D07855|nr:BamA/TamA family outer membrane protein [Ramlibacter sp.]MBA2676772.1 BamA/TamA family outer membrane protein [Ramlibacter sp.]
MLDSARRPMLALIMAMAAASAFGQAAAVPSFDLVVQAPGDLRELLERNLELRRYREVADLDDAELSRLIVLAERDARQLLGTRGYFSPKIDITRDTAGERPRILMAVDPGTPTVIAGVDLAFEGDIATSTDADAVEQREGIRSGWGLQPGRPFTQEAWDGAKRQALRALTARRYPTGHIDDSAADIDAATNRGALGLRLNSGPLYRLGPLQVTGVEKYDPVLVPRFAQLRPGSIYERDELVQAQLRLTGSGYFDSAFIALDPEGNPAAAPVQVQVKEAPLQRLTFGIGVSTDSGVRASVEHTHNRLPVVGWRTVTKLNLNRKTPLAQFETTSIPNEDLWRWSALARAERIEDEGLLTQGERLRVGRFKSWGGIDRNYYLQYDTARARPIGGGTLAPEEIGTGSALSANYVWTGRYFNDDVAPTSGYGVTAELGGGVTLAGDNAPFLRPMVHGVYYRPMQEGRLQLRGELGAVFARQSARLPATQMFRTGGDTTVRGYGFQQIGVDLPNGRVGPGRYLASTSVEWQRPIRRHGAVTPFESMVFVDAGAVANRVGDLHPRVGAGVGARWRSPVGPLEVALAYGFQPRKLRLHFNVGVTF